MCPRSGLTMATSTGSVGFPVRHTTRMRRGRTALSLMVSSMETRSMSARIATRLLPRPALARASSDRIRNTCSDQPSTTV
ncbi:hypothetical protein [Streptosporangium minutum]|uniref:Uncharacterized protein n=1 Tax=Streptosporangium minutum TaxID=569862 RepID=A0A243RSN5_9ACTN|nr:hypothetical protein [Streptosporangium minutum]OUC98058.1 hypothetical protein CA984_08365 [Streptosporangium minutum]